MKLIGVRGQSIDKGKKNILFIVPRLPEYDRAAGDLRLYRILQILGSAYNVFVFNDAVWERFLKNGNKKYLKKLKSHGIHVLLTERVLNKVLLNNSFIAVVCEFYHIGSKYHQLVSSMCPKATFIIDNVDVHFLREGMMAETLNDEQLKKTADKTKLDELAAYRLADAVWVVSSLDKQVLVEEQIPANKIHIFPTIHLLEDNPPAIESRDSSTLLFVGGFIHQPNVDAMEYFYSEVLPLVRKDVPDVKLVIAGDSPPDQILKMAGDNIRVLGYVPETKPYLDSATISIAPLRYGAGLKGKVGEALASGVPMVTTSVGAQGMALVSGQDCFVSDSPEDFAFSIITLLNDPELRRRFSESGRSFMKRTFGFETLKSELFEFFESLPQ